jgi:hypothetical protein
MYRMWNFDVIYSLERVTTTSGLAARHSAFPVSVHVDREESASDQKRLRIQHAVWLRFATGVYEVLLLA